MTQVLDIIAAVFVLIFFIGIAQHVVMSLVGRCRCQHDTCWRVRHQNLGGWRWRCGKCDRVIAGKFAAVPPWKRAGQLLYRNGS